MSLGKFLKLDIRGASHAKKMTFSLENFPARFVLDAEALSAFMARRAPGRDNLSTSRRERDDVVWRGGFADGVTTGDVIKGEISSEDMRPRDYGAERTVPRPGHADFGQWVETGRIPTGGGKNSGRLTAPLCAAGALCLQYLERRGISVRAVTESIRGRTDKAEMIREIERAAAKGDSVGGTVRCEVKGLPPGIGGALESGIESALSAVLFAIPAVKGIEFGEAFKDALERTGSEANDAFRVRRGVLETASNRQGGVAGGRTNANALVMRLAVRPTPTVFLPQSSVDLETMRAEKLVMKGRHDPCIVRRALPVVEAAVAFALTDALLADEAHHPRVCLVLTGKTIEEDLAQFKSQYLFADMVELRADLLDASEREKVPLFPSMLAKCVPWRVGSILTLRRPCDGGVWRGSESRREAFFRKVFSSSAAGSFTYVDFEDGFGDGSLVKAAHEAGSEVIRSLHSFEGPPGDLKSAAKRLSSTGDVVKIAFMPRSLADVARVFRDFRSRSILPRRVICAMGPLGLATRVLAGRTGSMWSYASTGGLEGLGHVSARELVRDYRFRSVTREAVLFGVTGWPLEKTRSPEINNAAFAAEDLDAVMIPFPAKTAKEAFSFMKAMGMKGLAVTIPHKFAIMRYADRVDAAARRIGAANTLVVEGKKTVCYNTDLPGFTEAILSFAGGSLSGKKVALLGDGGAAQAVKAALSRLKARFDVFHRSVPPQGYDIFVNATPVDPVPEYVFTGREAVYDLAYVPAVTPLMARAAAAGCKVENGFSMLLAQARVQRGLYEKAGGG